MLAILIKDIIQTLKDKCLFEAAVYGDTFDHATPITAPEIFSSKVQPKQIIFINVTDIERFEKFANESFQRKALCVVGPKELLHTKISLPEKACMLFVSNLQKACSVISFTHFIQKPERMIAVTGSRGKTGSAFFTHTLASLIGIKSAYIGTMGVYSQEFSAPRTLTTPDPPSITRYINKLTKHGVSIINMEASSHSIDQSRLAGASFQALGLTHDSPAHLNYFKSREHMIRTKWSFLQKHECPCVVPDFLKKDVPTYISNERMVLTYGKDESSTLHIVHYDVNNSSLSLRYNGKIFDLTISIFGTTQVYNALNAVLLLAAALGDVKRYTPELIPHITRLRPIPGRMEKIGVSSKGVRVFVDYANTPPAFHDTVHFFASMLEPNQKLYIVFGGSGGQQDPKYRPEMGRSANIADVVYVTQDNPYDADPKALADDILAECPKGEYIPERKDALLLAMRNAKKGDIVLALNKGDETYIKIEGVTHYHSDREILKELLQRS